MPVLSLALALTLLQMTERDTLIEKAMKSVQAAQPAAAADPNRPTFHFRSPANWMNDPNGTIFAGGWYHVFYQFNPYGDQWGHMHWGHARSRDLVDWEQLPVALWPSESEGEAHVFSGSTYFDGEGHPIAFYTSIGNRDPEQWSARPVDPDWIRWSKVGQPDLKLSIHRPTKVDEWRDPFLFRANGHDYLLTGGNVDHKGSVFIYQALDDRLDRWSYKGVLFVHPDADNVECPNIARIGDRWLLLTSVHGHVDAFVGTLDAANLKFTATNRSILADGSYASQLFQDADGNLDHLAWVKTEDRKGWNGWLTLPSTVRIDDKDQVIRQPIAALTKLRGAKVDVKSLELASGIDLTARVPVDHLEALLTLRNSGAKSIAIHIGKFGLTVDFQGRTISGNAMPPVPFEAGEGLELQLFIDGAAVDLYVNQGRQSASGVIRHDQPDLGFTVKSDGPATLESATVYRLRAARFVPSPNGAKAAD